MNRRRRLAVIGLATLSLWSSFAASAAEPVVSTYAGGGWPPEGIRATEASLAAPSSVAVGPDGSLYIAELYGHRVRRVDSEGSITTIAGDGTPGNSGDEGPARNARLYQPRGIAVDISGNVFVATYNRIRKIRNDGVITTVAGGGRTFPPAEGSLARETVLGNYLPSIAADSSGNIFFADYWLDRIWRVDSEGRIFTAAKFWDPKAVAVSPAGQLFAASEDSNVVYKVLEGKLERVAGYGPAGFSGDGGPATNAALQRPLGLAIAPDGAVYVGDTGNNRIRKVSPDGLIATIGGTGAPGFSGDGGVAIHATLLSPKGLAMASDGSLIFTDAGNRRIRRIDQSGVIETIAGDGSWAFSGDGGQAASAQLADPRGVAVTAEGTLIIADRQNHRIRSVDSSGVITTIAGTSAAGFSGDGGVATTAQLNLPEDVAVDTQGNVWVADTGNNAIRKISPDGVITTVAGSGSAGYSGDGGLAQNARFRAPQSVTVDKKGNVYIADTGNDRVRRIDTNGLITTYAGGMGDGNWLWLAGNSTPVPAATISFGSPTGVAVSDDGTLFIAAYSEILKVDPLGMATRMYANWWDEIWDVAPDQSGNLYFTSWGRTLGKIDAAGAISVVAGGSGFGFCGDGGPPLSACFSYRYLRPAVGPSGEIYLSDPENGRVRLIR